MIKVLAVDDSALMRRVLGGILQAAGDMQVELARDGVEALARLHDFKPDVVTLDVNMPHMDGLRCLDQIMVQRPCPVVMVSSQTTQGATVTLQALQLGAFDFIAKPAGPVSLSLDEFGPALIAKVRAAAGARVRLSRRLAERVRLRVQGAAARMPAKPAGTLGAPLGAGLGAALGAPRHGSANLARQAGGPALPADTVVLVGTSTGGPPALDALLRPLPADFPWPIVIAQHMPASFTGPLARRLNQTCALAVSEVEAPTRLLPGHAYIARGDADIIVAMRAGGPVAMPAPEAAERHWHPSVDRLVETAMAQLGPLHLVGVLMTGMGNDGATAMARLHRAGGRTIAEAEDTAVVWGMPGELVKAGGADVVAPLHRIAAQLLEWTP